MKRILPIIVAGLTMMMGCLPTFANDDKDDPSKTNAQPAAKTKTYSKYRAFMPAQNLVSKQILAGVEHQIESLERLNYNVAFSPSASFLADMPVSAAAVSDRDKAKEAIDNAISKGYMLDGDVQNAPPLQPVKLPLGIKKHFGQNNIVYLAFSKAVIKPTHAEITAFVKMEMYVEDGQTGTKKKKEIYFGADKIKLTNNGRILGDARLVLLGDYTLPLFNGKMKLVLKGGELSEVDGGIVNNDRTFAIIDCNGFREAAITADAIFDRKVMLPLDKTSLEPTAGEVTAHMRIEGGVRNMNDILGKMTFDTPFAITGHERWGFEVNNMFFDISTQQNYTGIQMLDEYLQKFPEEEGAGAWKGFGLNSFKLYLPKEFRKDQAGRVAIVVSKLIIDNEGISCNVGVDNVTDYGLDQGRTSETDAWRMSVSNFYLTFERSKLVGGKFGGEIRLPVSKRGSENNYVYSATIDFRGNYSLKVNPMEEIDFSIFSQPGQTTKAYLSPQSFVELAVVNEVFRPKASLSGYFEVKAKNIKKEGSTGQGVEQKSSQRVTFQELELTTEKPFIKLKYAGYNRQSEVANFPVTIDNFSVSITHEGQYPSISLGGGMNMNMMGESKQQTGSTTMPSGASKADTTSSSTPQGFSVKSKFKIKAKMVVNPNESIHQWEFEEFSMTPSGLNASIGKYKFVGELDLFDDGVRGKGFKAMVQFSKKEKAGYELLGACFAMFGNRKDNADGSGDGTRYWIVEAFLDVKVAQLGPVELRGVGGGVYHHLYPAQSSSPPLFTTSTFGTDVSYSLNTDVKLGFKVVAGMKLPKVEAFKGLVGFEITFNNNWGIKSVGLFGNATMAAEFKGFKGGKLLNTIGTKFASMANKATSTSAGQILSKSKLIEKANSEFNDGDADATANEGQLSLKVSLLYQAELDELHGEGEVFINSGVLVGIGKAGRAGWFVMHFDPKEWYIHAGSPTDRIGVSVNVGIARAKATTYFMIGHRIPAMPPPPPQMLSLLGPNYSAAVNSRNDTEINTGRGVAFGAALSISTGDLRAAIFYARLDAGLGIDAMLSKGNHNCEGMDGWYARGQAYAYVTGEVGITIKVAFIKKNFSILSAGAGVLLQVGMPNPAWFRGTVAGRYSVLGGAVKGNFSIKMSIGEECGNSVVVTTPPNETNDEGPGGSNGTSFRVSARNMRMAEQASVNTIATPLILSYTPVAMTDKTELQCTYTYAKNPDGTYKEGADSTIIPVDSVCTPVVYKNIQSIFVTPTITFNGQVGKPFEWIDASGNRKLYRIRIKEYYLKKGAITVPCDTVWSRQKEVMTIVPTAVLTKNSDYTFKVEAVLEQDVSLNNVWTEVPDGGRIDIKDSRIIAFRTGEDDPKIPTDNIAYTYPVIDQEYFYKGASSAGTVKLKRDHPLIASLSSGTIKKRIRFTNTGGTKIDVPFTCTANTISYTIPAALVKEQKYNVRVMYWPVAGKDSSVTLLMYNFGISKYDSVAQKLASLTNSLTYAYKGAKNLTKDVVLLNANANYGEPFELIETKGSAFSNGKLLQAQAKLTDSYYTNSVMPLLYKDNLFNTYYPAISNLTKIKNEVFVSDWYVHNQKWKTATDSVKKRQPYAYSSTSLFTEDFENLQGILAEKYYSDATFKSTYNGNANLKSRTDVILTGRVPYLENGSYTIDIAARLPATSTYSIKNEYVYTVSGLVDDRGTLSGQTPGSQAGDTYYVSINFLEGAMKTYCPTPLLKLISTSKIYSGAVIKINAELEITLDEGFEAEDGSDFEAEIKACTNL